MIFNISCGPSFPSCYLVSFQIHLSFIVAFTCLPACKYFCYVPYFLLVLSSLLLLCHFFFSVFPSPLPLKFISALEFLHASHSFISPPGFAFLLTSPQSPLSQLPSVPLRFAIFISAPTFLSLLCR